MYGARILSSSTVNNCRYGNIFLFVRSELDREIQGLLLYGVLEICELKVVISIFVCSVKYMYFALDKE